MPTPSVAALYAQTRGVYYGVDGVDAWGLPDRDAREYDGPHPVIAHPPCERWGRYARGGPNPRARRRELGDDNGCFAAALASVRRWGGVLEHPADSHAWLAHGLIAPSRAGGWVTAGDWQGWTCYVEQGHYGHRARKGTWLYAVGCVLPSLVWGPSAARVRLDEGFHSAEERRRSQRGTIQRLAKRAAAATPIPFRDVLIEMARSVEAQRGTGLGRDVRSDRLPARHRVVRRGPRRRGRPARA
jgi:hypothetical protein